jgi:ABC-2 type transport system ATP-binding protein
LILDEPASGLDPAARRELIEVAIEALSDGSTLIFSSHHMQDVERLAARVVLIHDGRLLIDRPLDELRERLTLVALPPQSPVTIADLRQTDGCLGARAHNGVVHAVFERQPREVETALAQRFDLEGLACSRPSLEDFFIETVKGQS